MAAKFKREFFKDGEILFGVFYPTRCIIAVFETGEEAEAAVADLTKAGCEARHATPREVRERAHEYLHQHVLTHHLRAAITVDERAAVHEHIALARAGAALRGCGRAGGVRGRTGASNLGSTRSLRHAL